MKKTSDTRQNTKNTQPNTQPNTQIDIKDIKRFDLRLLERKLTLGTLSKKDYDSYLSTLPDNADNVAYTNVRTGDASGEAAAETEMEP